MPYVLVNPRDLNRTDKKQLERNNIKPDGPIQVATALELSQEQINSSLITFNLNFLNYFIEFVYCSRIRFITRFVHI